MRLLLTGGGTGGHIYPALAIANYLKERFQTLELLYVGTKEGLESSIVPQSGIAFKTIDVCGLPRKVSPAFFKAGLRAVKGSTEAIGVVSKFKPDIVVGTGGYVCGPVVLAAKMLGKPAMIHEQNAFPGLTNRILAKLVDKVMVNFSDAEVYFDKPQKIAVTGLPVRQEIVKTTKEEGLAYLGLENNKTTLLISGGSRGARSINRTMAACYPQLLKHENLQIIHLTGKDGYKETMEAIKKVGIDLEKYNRIIVKPYLNEMEYALNAADFCIGRAGATYLAELTACGLPSILIPYPFASENHQEFNAKALVDKNAAIMILDKELNKECLIEAINRLELDESYRNEMARNAKDAGDAQAIKKIAALIEPYLQSK